MILILSFSILPLSIEIVGPISILVFKLGSALKLRIVFAALSLIHVLQLIIVTGHVSLQLSIHFSIVFGLERLSRHIGNLVKAVFNLALGGHISAALGSSVGSSPIP